MWEIFLDLPLEKLNLLLHDMTCIPITAAQLFFSQFQIQLPVLVSIMSTEHARVHRWFFIGRKALKWTVIFIYKRNVGYILDDIRFLILYVSNELPYCFKKLLVDRDINSILLHFVNLLGTSLKLNVYITLK